MENKNQNTSLKKNWLMEPSPRDFKVTFYKMKIYVYTPFSQLVPLKPALQLHK